MSGASAYSDQVRILMPDESNYDGNLKSFVNLKSQKDMIAFLQEGSDQLTEIIWEASK